MRLSHRGAHVHMHTQVPVHRPPLPRRVVVLLLSFWLHLVDLEDRAGGPAAFRAAYSSSAWSLAVSPFPSSNCSCQQNAAADQCWQFVFSSVSLQTASLFSCQHPDCRLLPNVCLLLPFFLSGILTINCGGTNSQRWSNFSSCFFPLLVSLLRKDPGQKPCKTRRVYFGSRFQGWQSSRGKEQWQESEVAIHTASTVKRQRAPVLSLLSSFYSAKDPSRWDVCRLCLGWLFHLG